MLTLVLVSIILLCVSALIAAAFVRSDRYSLVAGTAGALVACALGGSSALWALLNDGGGVIRVGWTMPLGEFHVALDALSSFFLVCIFLVSGLAALYGSGYLHAGNGRRLAPALFFFNLLVAAMAMTVIARDGILFLLAWEAMTVASFFLVTRENDREEVRRAGLTYLVASHLGAICLFALFALLGRNQGSYDFDAFSTEGSPYLASTAFLLAIAGFGVKAGFWPLHVWLPEAHPAAPSHVSALMSGAMIKLGIYGFLRILLHIGRPPGWWGIALLAIGGLSGVLGILHALAQRDLKRLLAYSSVENVGIVALGIGVGLLGQSSDVPSVAFLGYAGALLHVLNHAIFKGVLFQCAGSVLHGVGSGMLDAMGGLSRRMPVTAAAFLIASVTACGLPPFGGFVGEWLIFVGAFRAGSALPTALAISALFAVPALALIGGLAAACFVKAFGVIFLGVPRREASAEAREAGGSMRTSMMIGAFLCVAIGLWPMGAVRLIAPATLLLGRSAEIPWESVGPLSMAGAVATLLVCMILLLVTIRLFMLRGRKTSRAATWGCGYDAPTPRMQYTASSFGRPILTPCAPAIGAHARREGPDGFFPGRARFEERIGDVAGERLLAPVVRRMNRIVARLRRIQQGHLQMYLVYIALTLIALLVWQLLVTA